MNHQVFEKTFYSRKESGKILAPIFPACACHIALSQNEGLFSGNGSRFGIKSFSMFILIALTLLLFLFSSQLNAQEYNIDAFESSRYVDADKFAEPSKGYRQYPWLTYNLTRSTEESLTNQVRQWAENDLSGGFYLGMGGGNTTGLSEDYLKGSGRRPFNEGVAFLSSEYFELYASTIEAGLKYGNPPIVFYDEVGYPSGMAGGLLYSKYPESAAKSIEKIEMDVNGPVDVDLEFKEGDIIMGAVRMNLETRELVEISEQINKQGHLVCAVPEGKWKVMGFYLNPRVSLGHGIKSGFVDYLDKESVRKYISLLYQSHYDHLKKYFGNVLKITHYDEPTLHISNGQAWTPKFNELFEQEHGYNPMKYYPALWYDIGSHTGAVRNDLWGFRAKLFSESYIKQLDDWCRAHDIMLSGHMDQEEVANPVPVTGDFMRVFKYQQVPAIDDIWWWGRENRAYKLVSSSAYNWDKPFVMVETYAAYRQNMSPEIVYKVAMDQAAMGTNFQVGALPRDKTPESDRFIGRLCYMLQYGRHVADVAILYPISSLQAEYRFAQWEENTPYRINSPENYAREGGFVSPEIDYMELGEQIFRGLRQDFTYLHPEVLQEGCIIEGNQLVLNNENNREKYSVLIIPGGRVLSVETAHKIQEFYNAGGTVIATKMLAEQSKELGMNDEISRIIGEVFGLPEDAPWTAELNRRLDEFKIYFINRNDAGGQAYFLPDYTPEMLQAVMKQAVPIWDVNIEEPMWPVKMGPTYDGSLTYIHKVKDKRNIYFFANSSDKEVDTHVVLRGSMDLSLWNPMNGEIIPLEETYTESADGQILTQVELKLKPTTASFFVENQ